MPTKTNTMTPREFVKQWIDDNGLPIETISTLLESRIVDIVSDYHEQQVKSVDLAGVVGQSEKLVCDHDWQSVFHHDNLIGRYCPECKELRAD